MEQDRSFASAWRRDRLTVEERVARGQGRTPRRRRGRAWDTSSRHRTGPIPSRCWKQQGASRVPELVPIRYGRMLDSPFTFYRGAAAIMAGDLAGTPRSGVTVQLCGDAHLSNFGLFGTPERRLIFDINDFDETLPGPWEWDVKRLAASFEIMGRYRGFSRADRRAVVMASVRAYRERIRESAAARTLEVWYDHLEAARLLEEVGNEKTKGQLSKKEAARCTGPSPRRGPVTACACSRGGSARSTTSCASSPTLRSSCRSRTSWCPARSGRTPTSSSSSCSPRTGKPSGSSITRSRSSATSTRRARSSGSAASAPAATSSC